jgi:hypothetical protein
VRYDGIRCSRINEPDLWGTKDGDEYGSVEEDGEIFRKVTVGELMNSLKGAVWQSTGLDEHRVLYF